MKVHTLKITNYEFNSKTGNFIASSLRLALTGFGYGNQLSSSKLKELDFKIQLPKTKNGEIDFIFMENFIAELEAQRIAELETHLLVTGLKNYYLTDEEKEVLELFRNGENKMGGGKITDYQYFTLNWLFNTIKQGRRLKKEDQISGEIPFVMAGTTNTGVVNYISNPVANFPKNAITVDIFGNTFYRNYIFGAGDDTGVYWNSKKDFSQETMLYFATSMSKSLQGKFSFGKKLRSSQSLDFKISLPTKNGEIDFALMETLISAIQKEVIKDVVLYADKKIEATKKVVNRD